MRNHFIILAILFVLGCTEGTQNTTHSKPYQMSRAELAMVQDGIGRTTGLPNLLRVYNVSAAIDDSGTITACGLVSLDEKSTRASAFIGLFGYRDFSVVGIADRQASQYAIFTQCSQRGVVIEASGANASDAKTAEVSSLLSRYAELNRRCRGPEGASNLEVCEQRNSVGSRLGSLGWCLGKIGEAGYQKSWHICTSNSIRPR